MIKVSSQNDLISGVTTRLRSVIEFRGQSLREFAEETGIPYKTLQDYLAAKRLPGAEHLIRIGGAGVDVGWLLTGAVPFPHRPFLDDAAPALGAVVGDERFLSLIEREAYRATDQYLERRQGRQAEPLTVYQTLVVFGYYLQRMIRQVAEIYKKSRPSLLRQAGIELIIDMSTSANSADLDLKIDELIAAQPKFPPDPGGRFGTLRVGPRVE